MSVSVSCLASPMVRLLRAAFDAWYAGTTVPDFQRELRWNQAYYRLSQGL